jgi:hypothetical protein
MNPEQLKEYLSTFEQFKGMFGDKEPVVGDPNKQMEENKKNKEEVSAALEEGMKPSPDAVEVTGIDPNQSVFSENGAFNWSPSNQLEETAGVGTGSNTPAKTEVDNTASNAPATTSNQPAMIPDFTYDKAGNLIPTGKMKPNPNYQAPVASNVQTPGNVMPNVDGIEPTMNVMPVVPDNYDESAYGHQMLKRFGGDPYMPEFGEGGGFGKALGIGLLGAVAAPAVFGGIGALGAGMAAKRGMKKGQQVFGQGMEMGQQMNPMNMMQPMARFGMEMPQYFFGGANREARQNNRQFHRGMRQGNPFAAIQAYMQMGGQNMVQGWDQVREGVAGVGGPWVQSFHNIGKGLENMGVPRQFTDPAGAMMGQMGQAKYGMEYKEGGEYELSDAEIQAIIQAGGEVEFL